MKRPNSQYLNVKVCRCSVRWDQTPCELNLTLNNLLKAMEILEPFLKSSSSIILLVVVLLLAYIVCSTSFSRQGEGMEPPGPRALPLLGNMLQLDLKRPYSTLLKVTFYAPVRNTTEIRPAVFHIYCFPDFQEIWISVHCVLWTPQSGGSVRIRHNKGGTCQLC